MGFWHEKKGYIYAICVFLHIVFCSLNIFAVASDLKISTTSHENHTEIKFAWDTEVGISVFNRYGMLWIAFDHTSDIASAPSIETDHVFDSRFIEDISRIGTVITTRMIDTVSGVTTEKQGNTWVVKVFDSRGVMPVNKKLSAIRVMSKPYAAPFPHISISVGMQDRASIYVNDPYIGDSMIFVPMREDHKFIDKNYKFIDFNLPITIHGIAIEERSDNLLLSFDQRALKVRGAAGINIAARVLKQKKSTTAGKRITLKFKHFKGNNKAILNMRAFIQDKRNFYSIATKMKSAMISSDTQEEKYDIYTQFIMFYIAHGLYQEAISMIVDIREQRPSLYNSYEIRLMHVAALFMNYRYFDSHTLARSINIMDIPTPLRKEVRFWKAVSGYMVSSNKNVRISQINPLKFLSRHSSSFLSEYSDAFLVKFGIIILRQKIQNNDLQEAKSVIDLLQTSNSTQRDKNALNGLVAKYYAKGRDKENAIKYWDMCMSDIADVLNRTVCRYDKLQYLKSMLDVTEAAYIKELEIISQIWRGDQLEIDILRELGEIYERNGQYYGALVSWKQIKDYYPNTTDALTISGKMGKLFTRFFLDDLGKNEKLIESLALFYEFRDLIPIGAIGDKVIVKFSDYLTKLDLLDRAAALLTHQVTQRLGGVEKEEAINKLARIHVSNNKPRLALDVIAMGDGYLQLRKDIAKKRKYIHAQALFMNEEDDKVLILLNDDISQRADNLRSSMFWKKKDWKNFNKYTEPYIYSIRYQNKDMAPSDIIKIIKLSISYQVMGKRKLAKNLYEDFRESVARVENGVNIENINLLMFIWDSMHRQDFIEDEQIMKIVDGVDKIARKTESNMANSMAS